MNKFWIFVLSVLALAACNTDSGDFDMGPDLIDTESSVLLIDTFSVNFATVQVDSMVASNAKTALIGNYESETAGELKLKHFFNIDPTTVDDEAKFDSITVQLNYTGYYLGEDTISPIEFSMYQLSEELEIYDDPEYATDYNYNTTQVDYSTSDLVGTYFFTPKPSKDSIEFRINDEIGEEILDWLIDDDITDAQTDRFRKYFKGFVIEQTGGNPMVLGFDNSTDASIQIRIYTHDNELENNTVEYEFNTASNSTNFSQANIDRSGTVFENLVDQEDEIPSSQTDDLGLIQGAAGAICRVNFPSINSMFGFPDTYMLRAELVLVPSFSKNDIDQLPSELYFYQTDKRNNFSSSNIVTDGTGGNLTAYLYSDKLNNIYYYAVDITTYMSIQLANNEYDADNGLVVALSPDDVQNTADVLLLSTTEKTGNIKTKLNLYFLRNE